MKQTEENILNLVMRKVHALEILKGEKVREYRPFNDHWAVRICRFEDPKNKYLATGVKDFTKAHFYPYNQKWFLDVAVKVIGIEEVTQELIDTFKGEFEAPIGSYIIIIRLGDVLDTNLSLEE